MADPLIVRLSGHVIGELQPGGVFRWEAELPADVPLNAPVLSYSLPFGHSADAAPFFGGLLPEGVGLERLAREVGVASSDLFGLLEEVGADVGGSVTIGEPNPPLDPLVIEEEEIDRVLERAHGYIRGSAVGGGGSAATGVQSKIALTLDHGSGQWMIGRGSTPSTHLLKPVPIERAALLYAEAALNTIARDLGLSHHEARVEASARRAVLIVERYDRVVGEDGRISRVHQEDSAQALGLPWGGNDKFESVNPRASLRAVAQLLDRERSLFDRTPSDREKLLALVTLNVVAGNTDAHAKNFSLLLPPIEHTAGQSWTARLADAYDLVPQSFFEADQSPFAMRVGGEAQPGAVTAEHIIAEGVGWGIVHSDASRVVAEALQAVHASAAGSDAVTGACAEYLLERTDNLLRGDQVWTRRMPPALCWPEGERWAVPG